MVPKWDSLCGRNVTRNHGCRGGSDLSEPEEVDSNEKTPGEVQGANHVPHRAKHPPSGLVCTLGKMARFIVLRRPGTTKGEPCHVESNEMGTNRIGSIDDRGVAIGCPTFSGVCRFSPGRVEGRCLLEPGPGLDDTTRFNVGVCIIVSPTSKRGGPPIRPTVT